MPALILLTPGLRARLDGECMKIRHANKEKAEESIHLRALDHILLDDRVDFTLGLLASCLRRHIPVIITDHGQRILGCALPPAAHAYVRFAQFEAMRTPALIAAPLVAAKIKNQRRLLQRLSANRAKPTAAFAPALGSLLHEAAAESDIDRLRGIEGRAARLYFAALDGFFPESCRLIERTRQPPKNEVNATLSFGYTILGGEMICALHSAGLDPAFGFLHAFSEGRPSLALDMIEPFRPAIADALTLDLIGHAELRAADHFEARDGGVFLNTPGRKVFFAAWEARMTRVFTHEQSGFRTTPRDLLKRQALLLKARLMRPEPFTPFEMN
jgi:CRISPR-associated protein Cas1